MPKFFYCYNHQGKADLYIEALLRAGWQASKDPGKARFILTDVDIMPRARTLREYRKRGIFIICYPHAARPNLFWDFDGHGFTDCIDLVIVPAVGHEEILRAIGAPYPIEIVGWHLSEIKPFKPKQEIKKILFAPIHPNSNGFLSSIDKGINRATFEKLLSIASEEISVLIRYLRDLKGNGLWKAGGFEYIQGEPDGSTQEIDRADLVVSHQTFAFLAVARGIPTLMMAEDRTPRWGGSEEKLRFARSWDKYRELLRYPLDILDPLSSEPLPCLIERAGKGDPGAQEWRRRMIGSPLDPALFVNKIESYL